MAGETKLWEQVKHLLTPLRLPDLDPEKLKSVTAAEEVELRPYAGLCQGSVPCTHDH